MTSKIIETVSFKLNEGVSDEAFLMTCEAVSSYLRLSTGFIKRKLSKAEDDTWMEHIEWKSLEDAKAASKDFMSQESLMPYLQSIQPDTITMSHQNLKYSFG